MKEGFYMPKSIHLTGRGGSPKTMDLKRLNHLKNNLVEFKKIKKSFSYDSIPTLSPVPIVIDHGKINLILLDDALHRTANVKYYDTLQEVHDEILANPGKLYDLHIGDDANLSEVSNVLITNCTNQQIVNVYIGACVRSLGTMAFNNNPINLNNPLKTVTFAPTGCVSIGDGAFAQCCNLESVTFPQTTLRSIGDNAFSDTKKISELTLPGTLAFIGRSAFTMGGGQFGKQVPCRLTFGIPEDETILVLSPYSFTSFNATGELRIPSHVKNIPHGCFHNSYSFGEDGWTAGPTSIVIEGAVSIEGDAFSGYGYYCNHIELSENNVLRGIGDYAFECFGAEALTSIDIPSSVQAIGTRAFNVFSARLTDLPSEFTLNIHNDEGVISGAPWGLDRAGWSPPVSKYTINYLGTD